uniref:Uncharacterized protein n=1 Tax=Rhizophora mucronata TaxID=61149 RepID=A0A2P2KCN6_RHIMU
MVSKIKIIFQIRKRTALSLVKEGEPILTRLISCQ